MKFEIFGKDKDSFNDFFSSDSATMKEYGSCCKCCMMGRVLTYENKEYCEKCLKKMAGEVVEKETPFLEDPPDEGSEDPFIKILKGDKGGQPYHKDPFRK